MVELLLTRARPTRENLALSGEATRKLSSPIAMVLRTNSNVANPLIKINADRAFEVKLRHSAEETSYV